jgi:hypothetical protein
VKGLRVEGGGIPHLAKNERDVGHPSFVVWRDFEGGFYSFF